jgi:hypothetical protein
MGVHSRLDGYLLSGILNLPWTDTEIQGTTAGSVPLPADKEKVLVIL